MTAWRAGTRNWSVCGSAVQRRRELLHYFWICIAPDNKDGKTMRARQTLQCFCALASKLTRGTFSLSLRSLFSLKKKSVKLNSRYTYHSCIFSNPFIGRLYRGILDVRQEYTPNMLLVNRRAMYPLIHLHIGGGRKPKNLEENHKSTPQTVTWALHRSKIPGAVRQCLCCPTYIQIRETTSSIQTS